MTKQKQGDPLHISDARREYLTFLRMKFETWELYHNHKESSAWVTTAAYVGIAGYIALNGAARLPPGKPNLISIVLAVLVVFGLVAAARLIFWQLKNRRNAVIAANTWREQLIREVQAVMNASGNPRNLTEEHETEFKIQEEIMDGKQRRDAENTGDAEKRRPIVGARLIRIIVVITGVLVGSRIVDWILTWDFAANIGTVIGASSAVVAVLATVVVAWIVVRGFEGSK